MDILFPRIPYCSIVGFPILGLSDIAARLEDFLNIFYLLVHTIIIGTLNRYHFTARKPLSIVFILVDSLIPSITIANWKITLIPT